MEWNGMEWNGMEWNGMEWNGMERNGMFQLSFSVSKILIHVCIACLVARVFRYMSNLTTAAASLIVGSTRVCHLGDLLLFQVQTRTTKKIRGVMQYSQGPIDRGPSPKKPFSFLAGSSAYRNPIEQ
jgi:hypothetical protein